MRNWFIILVSFLLAEQGLAGIVITGTRVIYPSNQEFVAVQLNNVSKNDVLVQSWINVEKDDLDLTEATSTFLVTPPISKVEGNKGHSLRIIFTNKQKLEQDRETLFWFNVLEIPEKPKDKKNYLQFAVRSKLKLFYRPTNLTMSQEEAFQKVKLNLDGEFVVFENPTPYYINIGKKKIYLKNGLEKNADLKYMNPYSTKELKDIKAVDVKQVDINFINDYGNVFKFN